MTGPRFRVVFDVDSNRALYVFDEPIENVPDLFGRLRSKLRRFDNAEASESVRYDLEQVMRRHLLNSIACGALRRDPNTGVWVYETIQ